MEFNFEKLEVYKKALNFANSIYNMTSKFPKEERFVLVDQFRRAAISISLNIAEGQGCSNQEFKRYLKIARGSVKECVALISLSELRKYLLASEALELRNDCTELSKMLSGLIKSLITPNSRLLTPNS